MRKWIWVEVCCNWVCDSEEEVGWYRLVEERVLPSDAMISPDHGIVFYRVEVDWFVFHHWAHIEYAVLQSDEKRANY